MQNVFNNQTTVSTLAAPIIAADSVRVAKMVKTVAHRFDLICVVTLLTGSAAYSAFALFHLG